MWWYRDPKSPPVAVKPEAPERRPAADVGRADLSSVVAQVLAGGSRDPDAILVMSLLIDSRIELADGTVSDGMTWLDAERTIATALGGGEPVRLYNRFAKDFGEGFSTRKDVLAVYRDGLARLRAALKSAKGVKSVGPRTPRKPGAAK